MIGEIENAIQARLQAAADDGVLGYAWRQLASLPVDLDDRLAEAIQTYPSAWTVFGGWRTLQTFAGGSAKVEGTFHLVVAAQSLRNEAFTRHSATASEPGSYQLVKDAAALLAGQALGLEITPLELGACTSLYNGVTILKRRASLLALELRTQFLIAAAEPIGDDIGDFANFHVAWDVPPHGGIDADPAEPGVQLPDDEHTDAVSHITLPIQETTP